MKRWAGCGLLSLRFFMELATARSKSGIGPSSAAPDAIATTPQMRAAALIQKARFFITKLRSVVRDDDHAVILHCGSSWPACSATMYAAYQSAQFASRCP